MYLQNFMCNFMHLCHTAQVEKLHMKFCKYILGTHKYATNAAVLGELGRFPILINILDHTINYYNRVEDMQGDALIKQSYLDTSYLANDSKHWHSCISKILNTFPKQNDSSLTGSMRHLYERQWHQYISRSGYQCSNKLQCYSTFKNKLKRENYIVSNPINKRRNLTKLRISAHDLAVETGRYTSPKTPREQRTCILCTKREVEDEFHFLIKCDLYDNERKLFFEKLESYISAPLSRTYETFIFLMHYCFGDTELSIDLCNYVNSCTTKRRKHIENIKRKGNEVIPTYIRQ